MGAIVNVEAITALIHIDPVGGGDPSLGESLATPDDPQTPLSGLRWYCDHLSEHSDRVCILLPERLRNEALEERTEPGATSLVWYGDDGSWKLPRDVSPDQVWLINGERLPIVDWTAMGESADRAEADILVFDPSTPCRGGHYSESVLVDTSGAVVQVRRHYDDSPSFTDLWSGQASFLMTSAKLATPVVTHVLLRGWDLESIGALTRRYTVRWSEAPSALLGSSVRHVVTGPLRTTRRSTAAQPRQASTRPQPRFARVRDADRGRSAPATASPVANPPSVQQTVATRAADGEFDDFVPARCGPLYAAAKRAFDLLVCGTGLVVLSPLLLLIAALIKLTSAGPVFFAHNRQGRNGRTFACLKFRSMSADADALQAKLRAKNEVDGPQFKMVADPRVTWLGGWLRRLNLDELPQLINVVLGQMSLVGPRPSPDAENQVCPPWRRARLSVKPGITGLWQVLRTRDRPDTDFQEWIYYDVEYARHRSLWLDFWILLYTPVSMFAPRRLTRFVRRLERRGICLSSDRRGVVQETRNAHRSQARSTLTATEAVPRP